MLLPDRVAIINGGATGMGRATAIRFAEMGKSVPLQRIGTAEDIANAILFFSSELSSWVSGETLIVGGGRPLPTYRDPI